MEASLVASSTNYGVTVGLADAGAGIDTLHVDNVPGRRQPQIARLNPAQLAFVVVIVLALAGLPVAELRLPPEAQTVLNSELVTIPLAVTLAIAVIRRMR
jgi:hypothetical protein